MSDAPFADPAGTWNERFATADYLFGEQPNEYLRASVGHLTPGGRVLCVADGEGRNSVWLARQGFAVEAFDIAEQGVAKARSLAARHGVTVRFDVAAADDWRWPADAYDAVLTRASEDATANGDIAIFLPAPLSGPGSPAPSRPGPGRRPASTPFRGP